MLQAKTEKTKLIFISSVGGGIACFPKFTLSDGMSKCAVAYLAKQLAAENTHTLIDVFCISPGAIETPMFYSSTLKNMSPEERKAWLGELLRDESTCSTAPTSTPPWVWAPGPASRRRPAWSTTERGAP